MVGAVLVKKLSFISEKEPFLIQVEHSSEEAFFMFTSITGAHASITFGHKE